MMMLEKYDVIRMIGEKVVNTMVFILWRVPSRKLDLSLAGNILIRVSVYEHVYITRQLKNKCSLVSFQLVSA